MSEQPGTKTALLLVDHGSRSPAANAVLAEVAALIRRMSGQARVYLAHMEFAEPSIAQGFAQAVGDGAARVVVHPYFLSPGRHSQQDVPRMVAEAAQAFPGVSFAVTEPLGVHPKIVEVILERSGIPLSEAPQD